MLQNGEGKKNITRHLNLLMVVLLLAANCGCSHKSPFWGEWHGYGVNSAGINACEEITSVLPTQNTSYQNDSSSGPAVRVVQFSDFECSHCFNVEPEVAKLLKEYGDQVQFQFKHFPMPYHRKAFRAAVASECARDQGMFNEYKEIVFMNQNVFEIEDLKRYALELGLDAGTFNKCLSDEKKDSLINKNIRCGLELGVEITPSFQIGTEMIHGAVSYETLKQAFLRQRARVATKSSDSLNSAN